jgi:hypothetical protein
MESLIKELENACAKTLSNEGDKQVFETITILTKLLTIIYNNEFDSGSIDIKLNSNDFIYSFVVSKIPKCKIGKVKITKQKEIKAKPKIKSKTNKNKIKKN